MKREVGVRVGDWQMVLIVFKVGIRQQYFILVTAPMTVPDIQAPD